MQTMYKSFTETVLSVKPIVDLGDLKKMAEMVPELHACDYKNWSWGSTL